MPARQVKAVTVRVTSVETVDCWLHTPLLLASTATLALAQPQTHLVEQGSVNQVKVLKYRPLYRDLTSHLAALEVLKCDSAAAHKPFLYSPFLSNRSLHYIVTSNAYLERA